MQRFLLILILCICGPLVYSQQTYTLDSTVLTSRVVKGSLDIPWEITWGPDDHIWATERFGRVSRINPSTGAHDVILDISSDVYMQSETGMLGMVLHPDFENSPEVFIVYTYLSGSDIKVRLVKFNYNGTNLIASDTLINNIKGFTTHVGSRLIILPDTTLLMTTGDAQDRPASQDTNALTGKILRINLDGSIPKDNPIPGSYVYSLGHRNAQGLCLAPNGMLYSSEHGPRNDDELNLIAMKGNYGWPSVMGYCDSPPEDAFCAANNVVEPLVAWTPTIAPSDIIWYSHKSIPEFKDKLFLTLLKDKSLIVFGFNGVGDSLISEDKYFKDEFGRLRDVCISPSGKIYLATSGETWSNTDPFTHSIIELSNENYVSIEETSTREIINIGPNPIEVGEKLNLELRNGAKGHFTLYDIYGRVVLKKDLESLNSIEMPAIVGVYFWEVELSKGRIEKGKLLVK